MKQYYPLFYLLVLASCNDNSQPAVEELYTLKEGRFTSEEQAKKNPDYYNTTIRLAHIWEQRDGYWVYGEYSLISNPDSPYAQRIYQLMPTPENPVRMESYDLEEKHNFIGK